MNGRSLPETNSSYRAICLHLYRTFVVVINWWKIFSVSYQLLYRKFNTILLKVREEKKLKHVAPMIENWMQILFFRLKKLEEISQFIELVKEIFLSFFTVISADFGRSSHNRGLSFPGITWSRVRTKKYEGISRQTSARFYGKYGERKKPFYVSTPIFYVNAGTFVNFYRIYILQKRNLTWNLEKQKCFIVRTSHRTSVQCFTGGFDNPLQSNARIRHGFVHRY